ncbi:CLAVATA3/ESR (CLE)-related protein TDIF-like [Lactuca sativa]|uniref:CLAVATA3/ESR (CLE)-related protein TDIF-like n=1 Tax=Lactuca sativa TaxID=4236 RepID=UPI000CA88ABD|nr:CLAVATA3/ESR (CLE)-related protein TDIF-like [Lactuca sativa]
MDIDLLWSFGGWFLIILPETINCMAKLRSSSQISLFSNPSSGSSLLCIALLIFIFFIIFLQSPTSMAAASFPSEATTSSYDESSRTSTTTMDFRPKRSHRQSHSKPTRSFEAGAHEVPSGPNPISNR